MDTLRDSSESPISTYMIDDIDRSIIDHLRADSQVTNKSIASEIGVSESTVAHRIRSMSDNNVMRVVAQQDFYAGPYTMLCLVQIEVSGDISNVANALREIDSVTSVSRMMGPTQLLVNVRVRDRVHLSGVLMNDFGIIPGINRLKTSLCLQIHKLESDFGDLSIPLPHLNKVEDEDRNLMILRLLTEDGRLSNREIARQLDISEGSVRQRLKKMVDAKEVRLGVVCNGAAMDRSVISIIRVATKPTDRNALIEQLSEHDEVPFVATTAGEYDVWFLMQSSTAREVANLTDELLVNSNGVKEFDVLPLVENYLHRYDLVRIAQ